MGLAEEAKLREEIGQLRDALGREQRKAAKKGADTAELVEAVYRGAHDAALVVGGASSVPRPARDRRRSPEAALLHLTDWQAGKETPSYDLETCERRVMQAVAKTVRIAEIQRADHPVRECHVLLGGDLIEGTSIFPGQAFEVESGAFTQLLTTSRVLERALLELLGAFEKVIVREVWGNHGRIGRKGDMPREDNLDRMVGELARRRLEAQDRLDWPEPEVSWHRVHPIGDYRALLAHGDQVKSFGGSVPAFGILRKATAWASGVVEDFHDLYIGHFHTPMQLPLPAGGSVFVTPSTESGSEYAREFVAARGRPGQRLHFVDPRRGRVTGAYLLWLD